MTEPPRIDAPSDTPRIHGLGMAAWWSSCVNRGFQRDKSAELIAYEDLAAARAELAKSIAGMDELELHMCDLEAELDKLRAALQDMVDAGMRFDLNPTYDMREPHKFFSDYIARMDEALRERAQWALAAIAKERADG